MQTGFTGEFFHIRNLLKVLGLIMISINSHSQESQAMQGSSAIILVHGAFTDGSVWTPVIAELQLKGYDVIAVQNPLTSLEADVDSTVRAIRRYHRNVFLVGHSWGGAVITQAGNLPAVTGLLYLSALAPDTGESVNDLLSFLNVPLPKLNVDNSGFAWIDDPHDYKSVMADDLSQMRVNQLAAVQKPIYASSFSEKIVNAAWREKPTWYSVTSRDNALPLAVQEAIARRMNAKVTYIDSSHLSMLAHPVEVATIIDRAAKQAAQLQAQENLSKY
ncbi:alpha/beta hydrolase [Pseudomonas berkeleyensis]|uniref:Alpha/beta hydrolase n=1 Tax=Pseudomonas berkeleyensis TaxID=2726956 RepID=A0A7G5DK47_9PSED|nr:alpha/beta hydrolase [Pseudomonas berkeleyensis]QMV62122.1 alpha/beta hydrolase [Pseudomonas berkeleyensis]WSO37563.1 alpha/beta hydrolase [Pseudomonas berkeleyensis]